MNNFTLPRLVAPSLDERLRVMPAVIVMARFRRTCGVIQNIVEADIAKRQTASVYLKRLASLGMLSEIKVGREKLFIHPNFVRLLTSDDHPVLPYGDTPILLRKIRRKAARRMR